VNAYEAMYLYRGREGKSSTHYSLLTFVIQGASGQLHAPSTLSDKIAPG
jgi:hypothetical protein